MGYAFVNGNQVDKNYRIKDNDQISIITYDTPMVPTVEDLKKVHTVFARETIRKLVKKISRSV